MTTKYVDTPPRPVRTRNMFFCNFFPKLTHLAYFGLNVCFKTCFQRIAKCVDAPQGPPLCYATVCKILYSISN